VLGGLAVVAVLVFGVLPRFMVPAVVSHEPTAAAPVAPSPAPSSPTVPRTAARADEPARALAKANSPTTPAPSGSPAVAGDEFSAIVTAGFAALDHGELALARDHFARARSIDPASASVADGLARAEAGLLEQALVGHRQRAEAAEAREDWGLALQSYDAALKLEPAVSFGVAGRARVSQRAALDERLRDYLARPERLGTEAVAREAEAALQQANEAEPAGPRLRAQREGLERLLAGIQVPVPVRLVSDGLTEITIRRVGPLGAFKEKVVELRPGSYVVMGARAGYRDARRTLVVPIGKTPPSVDVRCDEAL
jgi:hypothetical protein